MNGNNRETFGTKLSNQRVPYHRYLSELNCIKQLYISSMQSITNGDSLAPYLNQPYLNQSLALKRHVRIKCSRLPQDFFATPRTQRYAPSPILSRQIAAELFSRELRTPSFQCRKREKWLNNQTIEYERKVETARTSLMKMNNEDQLISVVLSQAHKLRGMVGKQSLDMKQNYSMSVQERYQKLPQIVNKAAQTALIKR